MNNLNRATRNGFTLIELLVVIAIIALLLSILLPSLSLVKEKGKNLSCRTNIRSLGIGFRLYSETNGGKVFGYGNGAGNNLWLQHIADQIGDIDKIRYCPSTRRNEATGTVPGSAKKTWVWGYGGTGPELGSFGINGFLYSSTARTIVPGAEWNSNAWMNTTSASNSSSVPVFIDSVWVDLWPQGNDKVRLDHNLEMGIVTLADGGAYRNHMLRCLIGRHSGALSVAFLDGHVEPVHLKNLWTLKWGKQFTVKGEQFRSDGTPIYKK